MKYYKSMWFQTLTCDHYSIFYTSNRVSRIFWFGTANGGIEKMRSIFFQRSKNSGVPVTQPAGWGGESHELKKVNLFRKLMPVHSIDCPFTILHYYKLIIE